MELDVELHGRLVRMTDNPFLVRIMESIGRLARSSREFTNTLPRMREMAQADHERIVAAVAPATPRARAPRCERTSSTSRRRLPRNHWSERNGWVTPPMRTRRLCRRAVDEPNTEVA